MTPSCRFCGASLADTLVDLGLHPISNAFLTAGELAGERRFPLVVRRCPSCHLVQAVHDVPPEAMFTSDYVYFSSTSSSWVAHARRFAEAAIARFGLSGESLVVEVACNDGYLLRNFVTRGIPVLGVEPTESTARVAESLRIPVERSYFGQHVAERLSRMGKRADLTIGNNVLAHVPDLADFVSGFRTILKPEGVAVFEFPHLRRLVEGVQFDTIYHEHYSYLSLLAVTGIFERRGLRVFDVEETSTHGGSLRIYACRAEASHPLRPAVPDLIAAERRAGLDGPGGFEGFAEKVAAITRAFREFLDRAKREGKTVAAYGAAAKGNTFLNACAVTRDDMVAVGDKAPSKQGRFLPGSHVPVVTPERLIALGADYIVILPWNLEEEIRLELEPAVRAGARLVVAAPTLRVG